MMMYVSCARETGYVHAAAAQECQDQVAGFYDCARNLGVIALSDGAGSYQYSEASAKAVVEAVLGYFQVHETISDRQEFVNMVSRAAERVDPTNGDVGTTLLFAATTEKKFIAGHIGDGVILVRENGTFSVLSYPENGEYSWETYLLPCAENSSHFRFYEGKTPEGFLLASDGISAQLYESDGQGCPVCEKIFHWAAQMTEDEFCQKMQAHFKSVFAKFSSDDKSVAVLRLDLEDTVE